MGGCKKLKGTGGGNRQWPRVAGRKPRDPEDQILRKIHVGHLNADTDLAASQSYFEKFEKFETVSDYSRMGLKAKGRDFKK